MNETEQLTLPLEREALETYLDKIKLRYETSGENEKGRIFGVLEALSSAQTPTREIPELFKKTELLDGAKARKIREASGLSINELAALV